MQSAKLLKLLTFLAVLAIVMSATAQQIRFEDFSNQNAFNALLAKNGTVTQATWNGNAVMRMTDGSTNNRPSGATASSAWFIVTQPVTSGFTTYFQFAFHNPAQCCSPGDGLAFVIQNSSSTDSSFGATGASRTALGVGNGGVGYAGIPNSIAIEFDTAQDPWDPTSNHVALQTCGVKTNTPVHLAGQYTIGQNHNVTSCLYSQASHQQRHSHTRPHLQQRSVHRRQPGYGGSGIYRTALRVERPIPLTGLCRSPADSGNPHSCAKCSGADQSPTFQARSGAYLE